MFKVFEKWLIPINDKICYKNIDISPIILPFFKAFKERINKVSFKFSESEEVSGSICFFGGVFTSLLNFGYIKEIEGLFTFALCYMLVDHYLDNDMISDLEKEKTIKEIYLFISTGEITDNELIKAASGRYLELLERNPMCKKYFIQLFESEIKAYKIQKRNDLEREIYKKAAEEKGGLTSVCIGSIIGLNENDSFQLGSLIQFVDDLLDIKDDEKLGIYTLARYDLDHNNLDFYISEVVERIDRLTSTYNFFKVILLYGIILGAHDNSQNVSDDILKYDCIDKNISKEYIVVWFYNKLKEFV